ncbi:MAG: alpha/beta hydrolase [Candidatus Woesearchaeota archaeon]
MKQKTQILFIRGGMTFKNRKDYLHYLKNRDVSIEGKIRWHGEYLKRKLGKQFQLIKPNMPLAENAKYNEWKIHFERYFPYLRNNLILVGASLGGIFLARYLSENKFPKKILSLYLVAPPFDNTFSDEDLVGGFKLKSNLSLIEKNCKNIRLLFSQDDPVVHISHAKKYANKLRTATLIIYPSKNGHFKISEFPELVKMIKEDIR